MTTPSDQLASSTGAPSAAALRIQRLSEEPLVRPVRERGFFKGTLKSVRDLSAYRELLVLLVRRELKAKYKDSSLGFVWSLVKPMAQLLIYFVVIGQVPRRGSAASRSSRSSSSAASRSGRCSTRPSAAAPARSWPTPA